MELNYLVLRTLEANRFQLVFEYIYRSKKFIILVPAGFITDFASIPKIFHSMILPYGKHTAASVIHDWLYSKDCYFNIARREADQIFLEIMLENKVLYIQAYIMYFAVRLFGAKFYKK